VRAFSPEDVRKIQGALAELEPKVRDLLHSDREPPPVWMSDREELTGIGRVDGFTSNRGIVLLKGSRETLRASLAENLVSWYSFSQEDDFPAVVQRGLRVYVEAALGLAEVHIEEFDDQADWRPLLGLDEKGWQESIRGWIPEQITRARLFGWWLVQRIGLDDLRRMREEERTGAEDILRAAGLPLRPSTHATEPALCLSHIEGALERSLSRFQMDAPPVGLGRVRAFSLEEARKIQGALSELEPKVRALLHSEREPPRVWMSDREELAGSDILDGYTNFQGIFLGAGTRTRLRGILAHELAHWYSFDRDGAFPPVLEEGMALHVETSLSPSRVRIQSLAEEADWKPLLSLKEDAPSLDLAGKWKPEQLERYYLFGWWLVERIGLEDLRAMHTRGRNRPDDILDAAGLPSRGAPRKVDLPLLARDLQGMWIQEDEKPEFRREVLVGLKGAKTMKIRRPESRSGSPPGKP